MDEKNNRMKQHQPRYVANRNGTNRNQITSQMTAKRYDRQRSTISNWPERDSLDRSRNSRKTKFHGIEVGPRSKRSRMENSSRAERHAKNHTFEEKRPIGYKALETMLKIEDDAELILKLSSKQKKFLLLLDRPSIDLDFMCLILTALARASSISSDRSTKELLVHFYKEMIPKLNHNSNFHRELIIFINAIGNHMAADSKSTQKYVKAIGNLLAFLHRLQSSLFHGSFDAICGLMQPITAQIEFLNRKGNVLNEYIVDTLHQLNESIETHKTSREAEKAEILMEPPQDFREMSIHPDTVDILSDHTPFIRKNIVEGNYVGGVDHYLDIQFRLLREDFVRPLRKGINQYRAIPSKTGDMSAKSKFHIDDLNVYANVNILGSETIRGDQVHFCRFDFTPFLHLRWQVII